MQKSHSPWALERALLGIRYFVEGLLMLKNRALMPFIVLPIVINLVLFALFFGLFIQQIGLLVDFLNAWLPDWLEWLSLLLMGLAILSVFLLYYLLFVSLTNFIAAPFNALLSERTEQWLTGEALPDTLWRELWKELPLMLYREWQKMVYSFVRLAVLFLLGFVPVLGQTVVPILSLMFSIWMMAIQYCDYPFDNHKISFNRMRQSLNGERAMVAAFGMMVNLCGLVPVLNWFVMPAAVCGATAMWCRHFRPLERTALTAS